MAGLELGGERLTIVVVLCFQGLQDTGDGRRYRDRLGLSPQYARGMVQQRSCFQ